MNVLMWFRRDLRVTDNPALLAAAEGRVLPLFIADPIRWAEPDRAARQWAFVAESLRDLDEDLTALGAPLAVRTGETVTVLDKLCRLHRIRRVCCSDPPEERVRAWASAAGVDLVTVPPGPAEAPALQALPGVEVGVIPTARALRLGEDRCPHRQAGGRSRGLLLLESFLAVRGESYREAAASPLAGERASSRLSPHLTWGTLSRQEVTRAVTARLAERPGSGWRRSLSAFQARLVSPQPAHRPEGAGTGAFLSALEAGETGLPFVDAAMRSLTATGWLPDRMRAMLASVALRHLGLGEAEAGAVLARRFTDFDPSLHWGRMRRAATGPVARPLALAARLDPQGLFTRRWVPELAQVPDALLQEPWKWEGAPRLLGRRYPEAVVDPVSAERAAREGCRHRIVREETELIERYGQRPLRRSRPAPAAQLSLDL